MSSQPALTPSAASRSSAGVFATSDSMSASVAAFDFSCRPACICATSTCPWTALSAATRPWDGIGLEVVGQLLQVGQRVHVAGGEILDLLVDRRHLGDVDQPQGHHDGGDAEEGGEEPGTHTAPHERGSQRHRKAPSEKVHVEASIGTACSPLS